MSKAKVIHKDGLFVRKDKSRSSEWVRIIPCGEEFEFYEEYKGWLKVADGWVVCNDCYIQPVEVTGGGGFEFSEGTRTKRITLYPETELVFTVDSSGNAVGNMGNVSIGLGPDLWLNGGEKIEFVFDDSSYITTCFEPSNIGNSNIDGGISYHYLPDSLFVVNKSYGVEDGSSHKVAIYMPVEENVVNTFDPKYVPMVIIDATPESGPTCNKTFEEMCAIFKSGALINAFAFNYHNGQSVIEECGPVNASGMYVDLRRYDVSSVVAIQFKHHMHFAGGSTLDEVYRLTPNNYISLSTKPLQ